MPLGQYLELRFKHLKSWIGILPFGGVFTGLPDLNLGFVESVVGLLLKRDSWAFGLVGLTCLLTVVCCLGGFSAFIMAIT